MAPAYDADVIIVGAGPAGSSAAYFCAQAGLDVLLLEKATFPREKVCGDGLTPIAVSELIAMGVDISDKAVWRRGYGLRVYGFTHEIELPWPETSRYPHYSLTRPRAEFDTILAEHAVKAAARFQQSTTVTGPIYQENSSRIKGVTARVTHKDGTKEDKEYRSRLVIEADGNSARLAVAMGIDKNPNRPMGVAVRAYYRSPKHADNLMESHLALWSGARGASELMPGYGWIFPMADGTVNIGLGTVHSTATPSKLDHRGMLKKWVAAAPPEWELTEDNRVGSIAGAALPMAFNRQPLYRNGLLLTGDAGGMISPFNGEGIAYAMRSGRVAAQVAAQALGRTTAVGREKTLLRYPAEMKEDLGGYFSLGRIFVQLIEHPQVMRLCARYGLPHPQLMRFTMKLLADMYEPHGGDVFDRVIAGLARMVPKA